MVVSNIYLQCGESAKDVDKEKEFKMTKQIKIYDVCGYQYSIIEVDENGEYKDEYFQKHDDLFVLKQDHDEIVKKLVDALKLIGNNSVQELFKNHKKLPYEIANKVLKEIGEL